MTDAASQRTLPTVVVARRARPGHEREFERWLRRLVAAAKRAPGHVSSQLQPPDPQHPDDWVAIYQFSDAAHREAWIDSSTRQSLMIEGSDLIDGEAREQVLALSLAGGTEPVTAVVSFRVDPESLDAFHESFDRLVGRIQAFPGFLRCDLYPPVPGVQEESIVMFAFDSRDHLDAWLDSPERQDVLDEIDPLLEGERTVNVVGGFGGWFGGQGSAPVKRWKQAAVVLLALFPTALVLTLLRREFLPDIPLVPGVLLSNIVGVAILSWILMPWLTELLADWLRR